MRTIVLAGVFALAASTSLAQTSTPAAPDAPAAETAAPTAPATPAPAEQAAAAEEGGPANLCQELLAFMKAPPPEATAPAGAAKPAAAAAQQAAPAQQEAAKQTAPAKQGTTGSGDPAKSEGGSNSAQKVTGQDGVATDAPEPGKDKAASGSVANAPQKDSRAAPLPPADVTSTPKESVMDIARAEELATANDLSECQKSAREMRVAGVAMPPPLIALAALDLQYQQKAGAAPASSRTAVPAAPEQNSAAPAPQ